jgi:APA family basic amino acid/polyamine antiporter
MATEVKAGAGLLRQIGFVSATALVVSNMVGTGIFGFTGFMAGDLGSAGLILAAWGVGGLFALAGALSYAELGINYPSSGGEYVYLTRAYGPTWGFMTGWVSFFSGFSAPIAANALAFSDYLGYFSPLLKQENAALTIGAGDWTFKLGWAQVVACAIIALFTILNLFGVSFIARIQNALTATKLAVIGAFILLGFVAGAGSWDHFSQEAVRTSQHPVPVQFIISLVWVMVGYSGWNAATYVAEEVRRPERTLPLALTVGTALVTALYLGLNLLFIYSTPLEQMKGVLAIGSLSAANLFGAGIGGVFALLMAASIMATINAMVTIGPRVYYAMANNRAFFRSVATVHPRWHTPVPAILAQGACAMVMTVTPFPQLILYIGLTLTFFTVMSVASVLVFRRRHRDWQKLRAVSFAYPLVPLAYILVGATMCVYGVVWQPRASAAAFGTIGMGAAVYHFWLRRRVERV